MTTRYSSLVSVKKNIMQNAERVVQSANLVLKNATQALEDSYNGLALIETPTSGKITEFLSTRMLLDSQRVLIKHNEEWASFAENELKASKEALKLTMIEYEKFKYLEFKEIEKENRKRKIKEAKDLDEIALITHTRKDTTRVA